MAARTQRTATAGSDKATRKPASKTTRKPTKTSKTARAGKTTKAIKATKTTGGAAVKKPTRKPASKAAPKAGGAKAAPKREPNAAGTKAKPAISPVPRGYRTVTPSMNQADAKATIAFCRKAFGAKVRGKMSGPKGKLMHAEIEIGNSIIMLSDALMEPAQVSSLFLYVDNVDKTIAKAVKAGARLVSPANDMFWGDRFGKVVDPQGNTWSIGSRVEKVSPNELKKRTKAAAKQMAAALAKAG